MPDPFARLIPDARTFLAQLAANNTRAWFTEHKTQYEADLKTPATLLMEQFAHQIGPGTGTKLFRPQRDVRFSKDKTPYHTHLHMLWSLPCDGALKVGFFFGISPDYVSVGGGAMSFDKAALTPWRKAADSDTGAELAALLDQYRSQGYRIDEPELKRVPAPFDKDHPQGALLRRKSITVWQDMLQSSFSAPQAALSETYQSLSPLLHLLTTGV